ncbi:MAG: UDP-N-acetylmuramate dehydrogenase [Elusimicrobiaceae bacterium]|nr:UDP-N-acetylmuramate dehydrogenase [Elusimicrobiaceae bacterium]
MTNWKADFLSLFNGSALANAPLTDYTSYRIGGPAEMLALPADARQLRAMLAFAAKRGIPLTLLGAGTNVLVSDAGLEGLVCSLGGASGRAAPWKPDPEPAAGSVGGLYAVSVTGARLRAGAGAPLDWLARRAVAAGLGGLEKLSGIPGSAGGAAFMNAGAHGAETFDSLHSVSAVSTDGETERVFLKKELICGYRRVSGLEGFVITGCEWELVPGDAAALSAVRARILAGRAARQPLELPSAGSVFKRPDGDFASRLIDQAGLKGLRVGAAQVSDKHAGFIVNTGGATATDVMELIRRVRAEVLEKHGIRLELEQIVLPGGPQQGA